MIRGEIAGYPINPARDLSPRIFTGNDNSSLMPNIPWSLVLKRAVFEIALAGWGNEPFSHRNYSWFWVPVVGPHFGALLGAIIYQVCIGNNWPVLVQSKMESVTLEMNVQPRVTFAPDNAIYERPRNGTRYVRSRTLRQGERFTQS